MHWPNSKRCAHTCVTIEIIAQQTPPKNAVAYNIPTDLAHAVIIHAKVYGNDIIDKTRLRPCCITKPPNNPPNSPPKRRKKPQNVSFYINHLKKQKLNAL